MKKLFVITFILCITFPLSVNAADSKEQSLDTDKMLSDLQRELNLSKEQLEALKPILEDKNEKLKLHVDETVKRGYLDLDNLSERLKIFSKDVEKQAQALLNSDEIQVLQNYLQSIDKSVILKTRDSLVADLVQLLELTEEQTEKKRHVLENTFTQISDLLSDMLKRGSRNFDEFKVRYNQINESLKKQLREFLEPEQMEKFEKHNNELQEGIQQALFEEA